MGRRFQRAFRTLALNWAEMPPWERWAARLRATSEASEAAAR